MMMYGTVLYTELQFSGRVSGVWVCSTNTGMDFPKTIGAPRHDSSLQEPTPSRGCSALLAASGQPGAE